jgi:hypothetical protein
MNVVKTMGAVACLVGSLTISSKADDLTIISTVTGGRGGPGTQTIYMTGNKYRSSAMDRDVIVDVAAGKYTFIDNKKKQYWETTPEEMARPLQQNPQVAQMMEKLMGAGGPAEPVVQKGTGSKKIAGYDCDEYDISVGKMIKAKVWVAPGLVPPISPSVYANTAKAAFAGTPMAANMGKLMDEMAKIKGFPLARTDTTSMMGHDTVMNTEATEVKLGAIPDSAFAIPAGYTKVDSPMGKMQRH